TYHFNRKKNLGDIINYLGESTRPFVEGEALFNAGHITKCGFADTNNIILGWCLQTSALNREPHAIRIQLHPNLKKWMCHCSCKAGAGGKCKHIMGVLIFVYNNEVEYLSCTDVQQVWGKRKLDIYNEPTQTFEELCHVQEKPRCCSQVHEHVPNILRDLMEGNSLLYL
ncbi:hypothetical protein ILUMI_17375, partial [Ignelater luminosus]